jgi:hypothetical protein
MTDTRQLIAESNAEHHGARNGDDTGSRIALWIFGGVLVVAFPLLLFFGRNRWFLYDEWAFLADRDGGDIDDLLRPHAGTHWSTLPILSYRALWNVFGINTYLPYQVLLVLLHLTAAVLLRIIMRRAGVDAWIATAATTLFVFLGAGHANIVWAFQINEVGSLVFGLTFLLLADHDGPLDRRDAIGMGAGFAGLLCSGLGPIMVAVVGVASLFRRGLRIALVHTVPLAVIFLLWLTTSAWDEYVSRDRAPMGVVARFVTEGVANAFDSMGQLPGVGVLLAVLLVVGLVIAWAPLRGSELRRRAAAPAALLAGAVAMYLSAALQRAEEGGSGFALSSYYTHLFVAMVLPALAIAGDALFRRWRLLFVPVIAVFLVGVPGNLDAFSDGLLNSRGWHDEYRQYMLNAARMPLAADVPRDARPEKSFAPWVTMGWLVDGVAAGRVPEPDSVDATMQADATLEVALVPAGSPRGRCQPVTRETQVELQRGHVIEVNGGVTVVHVVDDAVSSTPKSLPARGPNQRLVARLPLTVRLLPTDLTRPPRVCT